MIGQMFKNLKRLKRTILIFIVAFSFIAHGVIFSANVLTKEALVKNIQNFFKKHRTMKGDFILRRGLYAETGVFFIKAPKFKMIFGHWNGKFKIENKTIVMDGGQLWAYLPSLKAVINQDISKVSGNIAYSGAGLGIRRLINKYHYKFFRGDNNLKKEAGLNTKVRILRLYKPKSFTGFKEIFLYVRDDGFIAKARAITNKNRVLELIRKNVKLNVDIDNKHFIFRVPKDAQIFKNPLVSGK